MAGINYVQLAKIAQTLIQQNGRTLTITLRSRTPADPTMPWRGPNLADSNSITVIGVVVENRETDPKDELVRGGDKQAWISALDTDPALVEQYDVLLDSENNEFWKIDKVDTIGPGATRVAYKLTLRS